MRFYKIVAADDELPIRNGLARFDWESSGFRLVQVAQNGEEALEAVRRSHADLLLSDIRMPLLDGLQTARQCQQEGIPVQIVLLTGYQDFAYAKQAIDCGVRALLTKPLDFDELRACLRRLRLELDATQRSARALEKREEKLSMTSTIAVCALLRRSILQLPLDARERAACLELMGCLPEKHRFRCAAAEPQPAAQSRMEQVETGHCACYRFPVGRRTVYVFIEEDENIDAQFYARLPLIFPLRLGGAVSTLERLPLSYNQALSLPVPSGKCKVGWWDPAFSTPGLPDYPVQRQKEFLQTVFQQEQLGTQELDAALDALLDDLASFLEYGLDAYRRVLLRLTQELSSQCGRFEAPPTGLKAALDTARQGVESARSPIPMNRAVRAAVHQVHQAVRTRMGEEYNHTKVLVDRATDYVLHHFSDPLTLDGVAAQIHISSGYLSVLFKKHTGKNFVKFLRDCRMDKARELLTETQIKVYEIASMTGYPNSKYFADLFKELFGLSPYEYRIFYGQRNNGSARPCAAGDGKGS